MIEAIKTILIKGLYCFLSISQLCRLRCFKQLSHKASMAKLMRDDQYAWNEQCARDMGVKIGQNCLIAGGVGYSSEPYLIEIGDNNLIAGGVSFITHDAGVFLFNDGSNDIFGNFGKIKIGNSCYLGANVTILPDIEIGDNCLIAAESVVFESIPANSFVMGNPAKVVFNIEFYRRFKVASKNTVRYPQYAYPRNGSIPKDLKQKILTEHFSDLPIRRPRRKRK